MYQAQKLDCRYPNYITFAWQRDSDCDYEIVGTLNGETIDDDALWNGLVEQTLATIRAARDEVDTRAYHREDVYSVIESEDGEAWEPISVQINA